MNEEKIGEIRQQIWEMQKQQRYKKPPFAPYGNPSKRSQTIPKPPASPQALVNSDDPDIIIQYVIGWLQFWKGIFGYDQVQLQILIDSLQKLI